MPAPLSIIIPTHHSCATLPKTLEALMPGLASGLIAEVIFCDSGQDPHLAELASSAGARLVIREGGRGPQLHAGALAAKADWFLFLHDDTQLAPNWAEFTGASLHDPDCAYYFKLAFDAEGLAPRWVALWANWRSRRLGLPYGDQGLLISARLYRQIGGYPSDPLMEDVGIACKLRGKLRPLPVTALTCAARYEQEGWLRRSTANLWLVALYFAGVSPQRLSTRYRRRQKRKSR